MFDDIPSIHPVCVYIMNINSTPWHVYSIITDRKLARLLVGGG